MRSFAIDEPGSPVRALYATLGYFRKKPNDKLTYANGADHDEVSDVNMTNRVGGL